MRWMMIRVRGGGERGKGGAVVTSKIATGNQIDFETLSVPPYFNRRHLSIVGSPSSP